VVHVAANRGRTLLITRSQGVIIVLPVVADNKGQLQVPLWPFRLLEQIVYTVHLCSFIFNVRVLPRDATQSDVVGYCYGKSSVVISQKADKSTA